MLLAPEVLFETEGFLNVIDLLPPVYPDSVVEEVPVGLVIKQYPRCRVVPVGPRRAILFAVVETLFTAV